MVKRRKGSKLEKWEVAIIKSMLETSDFGNDQDILAYFTRPSRSVNHREISEIRRKLKHKGIQPAEKAVLAGFIQSWPNVDPETGLNLDGDELLIKAREAMIAAVHTFNGAGNHFRSELFIVTAIIAWTYLMHSWFKREGIDYRHKVKGKNVKTKEGEDKYWELQKCLSHDRIPLDKGVKNNLEFLLKIRHEIEHRSTGKIDVALSAKLQACCLNFNDFIQKEFGSQYGLEKRLPIALQFSGFDGGQFDILKSADKLPKHIETLVANFHGQLTPEELGDQAFAYRVLLVPKSANRVSSADIAIEFVRPHQEEIDEVEKVLFKEIERRKFSASRIVELMVEEGYPNFNIHSHTQLWKNLRARDPKQGYGNSGVYKGHWEWNEKWVGRVKAHCEENADLYR